MGDTPAVSLLINKLHWLTANLNAEYGGNLPHVLQTQAATALIMLLMACATAWFYTERSVIQSFQKSGQVQLSALASIQPIIFALVLYQTLLATNWRAAFGDPEIYIAKLAMFSDVPSALAMSKIPNDQESNRFLEAIQGLAYDIAARDFSFALAQLVIGAVILRSVMVKGNIFVPHKSIGWGVFGLSLIILPINMFADPAVWSALSGNPELLIQKYMGVH